jgi:tetratricopeptide (TPR) repeat protein
MLRVTSLTSMDERRLNRLIKRVALLLVAGVVVFTAFYVLDRWRAPSTPMVDRQLSTLEQAVRDDPENMIARGQLADTYVRGGRFEEAITQYEMILATGKAEQLATYGRATAYMGLERYDLAATDYGRVVELAKGGEMAHVDPMLQTAYRQLGSIAMLEGRPADAIPLLEEALAIKRSDAEALYLIGTAYVATGETEKAATALRKAVAFVPFGWSEPYSALAEVYAAGGQAGMAEWAAAMADLSDGRTDEARTRLLGIVEGDTALEATVGLGLVAETSGDTAEAADWYRKALLLAPDSTEARMGLSRVTAGDVGTPLPALPTPAAPGGETD